MLPGDPPAPPGLRLLHAPERRRRNAEANEAAFETAGRASDDPGLREVYPSLPRLPISLVACPLTKDVNHGGLLRLAEAFRLREVSLSPEADGAVDVSGHRGALRLQPYRWSDPVAAVEAARARGDRVLALDLDERAESMWSVEWTFPLTLVLGAEATGVPPEVASRCDGAVAIPLFGLVTSLNVVSAAAIAVAEAVRALSERGEAEPVRRASRRLLDLPSPISHLP